MTAIAVLSSSNTNIKKKKKKAHTGPTNKKKEQKKRNQSVRIHLRNGRIYGSENGKTCHQCRQKTLDFSVSCNMECTLHFCYKCLLNRYGEIAEEIAGTVCQWKCPRCRGECSCSICMKKRGLKPTGILVPIAKSKGFSSVSEMLKLEKVENRKEDKNESKKKRIQSHEDTSTETRENSLYEKPDSMHRTKSNKKKAKNSKKSVTKKAGDNDNKVNTKSKSKEAPRTSIIGNALTLKFNPKIQLRQVNEVKMEIKVLETETEVSLPQGTELTKVANFDLLTEDVGHALQFLEFCEAFAQVLDLKKGDPELLLKEILSYQESNRSDRYSIKTLCIKLLSIILNDAEEGCSSKESIERNPLLEAFNNANLLQLPSELNEQCSDLKLDEYIELNSSRKLRILNFMCDEALGTQELRKCIEIKTLELDENMQREKLRDKMAEAIVLRTGSPPSIAEHKNLVSLIKMEVSKSVAEKFDEADMKSKSNLLNTQVKESDVIRSDPMVMDACGRKFWKLRGYSCEMNILRQDVSHGDLNFFEEKWFCYHINQKGSVETYVSSFKEK